MSEELQKKRPPAQASTALRVAFCLLRRELAYFLFYFLFSAADFLIVRSSRRFANCVICSLVAGFALMVYGYRIVMLRCR